MRWDHRATEGDEKRAPSMLQMTAAIRQMRTVWLSNTHGVRARAQPEPSAPMRAFHSFPLVQLNNESRRCFAVKVMEVWPGVATSDARCRTKMC